MVRARIPGLALTLAVAIASWSLAQLERQLIGATLVDALVIAILLGIVVRAVVRLPATVEPGVDFAAKEILEVAVLLLGASVDFADVRSAGALLVTGIVAIVAIGLAGTYVIGRALKLPPRLALLVAAGNAICGNSAIAALAPVIKAEREEVAAAIGYTAILGVLVVLGLPLLRAPLSLNEWEYGVVAGLTVYAVPQVLAAAFPISALAGQVATLVKLVRVLMLGPIVLVFTLARGRHSGSDQPRIPMAGLVPWFIVGFLALATLRSLEFIAPTIATTLAAASHALTLLAMAALGLGVDLRAVRAVGGAVVVTVIISLGLLLMLAVTLVGVIAGL